MIKPVKTYTSAERRVLCRLAFLFILISLAYSFFSHTLLHQLCRPVLQFPNTDLSYWVIQLLTIPSLLTQHHGIAMAFDLSMVVVCLGCLAFPDRRWLMLVFFILYFLYFISFNTYSTLHTHSKVGILLMPVPFMLSRNRSFGFLWEGLRYFTLFIYFDAFLWKLFRATFTHGLQGSLIIKLNLAPYLFFHPQTIQSEMYRWFLRHDQTTAWLFGLGMVLEGSFLVGFFTRRFDRWLCLFSILLPVGFIFFADAFFFEVCILSLSFVSLREGSLVKRLFLRFGEGYPAG